MRVVLASPNSAQNVASPVGTLGLSSSLCFRSLEFSYPLGSEPIPFCDLGGVG